MKVAKEKEQLKGLSDKDLAEKSNSLKRELFSIRLNSTTAHVKDYSQFKKLRKSVARTLTILSQKRASSKRGTI